MGEKKQRGELKEPIIRGESDSESTSETFFREEGPHPQGILFWGK